MLRDRQSSGNPSTPLPPGHARRPRAESGGALPVPEGADTPWKGGLGTGELQNGSGAAGVEAGPILASSPKRKASAFGPIAQSLSRHAFWLAFLMGLLPAAGTWVLMTQNQEATWHAAFVSAADERAQCLRHEMRIEAQVLLAASQVAAHREVHLPLDAWQRIPAAGRATTRDVRWIPDSTANLSGASSRAGSVGHWEQNGLSEAPESTVGLGASGQNFPDWSACADARKALAEAIGSLSAAPELSPIRLSRSFLCGAHPGQDHAGERFVALVTPVAHGDEIAADPEPTADGTGGLGNRVGYVASFLSVPEVYERAVGYLKPYGLDVRLEETGGDAAATLHVHRSRTRVTGEDHLPLPIAKAIPEYPVSVSIHGAEWRVVSAATPRLLETRHTWQPWGMAILLMVIAFGAATFIQMHVDQASVIACEVDTRTQDLSRANRRLRREVSRREAAEKELAGARDRAISELKKKSEFVANVSHEIRTPLNGILGMVELLGLTGLTEEQTRFVDSATTSGQMLKGLLADILDHSRLESNRVEIHPAEFSPRRLLSDVCQLTRREATVRGIDLQCHISSAVPPLLIGDPLRISQIVINLATNAVKFTEQGSVSVRLDGEATTTGWLMTICVVDTGVGIPRQQLERIFEPFHQLNRPVAGRQGGVGLGLTITKRLAEAMNGTIDVESEPGRGTRFRVRLPMALPVAPSAVPASSLALPQTQSEPSRSLFHLSQNVGRGQTQGLRTTGGPAGEQPLGKPAIAPASAKAVGVEPALAWHATSGGTPLRAIVADDNPVNRFLLDRQLQKLGCHVVTCETGDEALHLWESQQPDLLFADLHMPGLNGLDLGRAIREREQQSNSSGNPARTVLILVTAAQSGAMDAELAAAGFDSTLWKPYGFPDLSAIVLKARSQQMLPASIPA